MRRAEAAANTQQPRPQEVLGDTTADHDARVASKTRRRAHRSRGEKTHYAASLMSAADQQIPDDTRVVLEDLITETGR